MDEEKPLLAKSFQQKNRKYGQHQLTFESESIQISHDENQNRVHSEKARRRSSTFNHVPYRNKDVILNGHKEVVTYSWIAKGCVRVFSCFKSPPQWIINCLLSFLTVLFLVVFTVMVPIYAASLANDKAGSDAFVAMVLASMWCPILFFLQVLVVKVMLDRAISFFPQASWKNVILVGSLTSLSGVLMGFTCIPSRTPPNLQALLGTMLVPFTVIAKYILIRKGL